MQLITSVLLSLALSSALPAVNAPSGNLAVRGYDAVAYFTDGKPVPGAPQFEIAWNGARWRFANEQHRDAFKQAPEKYAPQFGGYCAWAVAHGYTANGDPQAWKIVDSRLYLNYSKEVQRMWEANIPEYIRQGQSNWPGVLSK